MGKKLSPTILLVEDDISVASVVKYNLQKLDYAVTVVEDGSLAIPTAVKIRPDIIILDWMMPGISGIEICKQVRQTPTIANTPILMLSARNEEMDKIAGLETGADDYLTKPFSSHELAARIKALIRRIRPAFSVKMLKHQDIEMDLEYHTVRRDGYSVDLSPIEFKILYLLMEHPGKVYSRENLMDKVWGADIYVGTRTVDVHITRLRRALQVGANASKKIIKTVRLSGYALVLDKKV